MAAFVAAARTLSRIRAPGIAAVGRWAEANGTGYAVVERPSGRTLAALLDERGTLPDDELRQLMRPLLDGLARAHETGVLHRQVSPGAITVRDDGTAVLGGFGLGAKMVGGARQVFDARASRLADITPGYAALEQYSGAGREGPWTDVYALGAVMYRCVAGRAPDDAPFRTVRDTMPRAAEVVTGGDPRRLAAIDAALALPIASRPQSVAVWEAMLFGDSGHKLAASRAGRMSARGFGRTVAPAVASQGRPALAPAPRPVEDGTASRGVAVDRASARSHRHHSGADLGRHRGLARQRRDAVVGGCDERVRP